MGGRKLKSKPTRKTKEKVKRFIRSAGGEGANAATLRAQADTPVKLLEDLVKGRLDPHDLSKPQRKAILLLQAGGKHTSVELASMLKVSPSLIRKDLQEIRREVGREVQEWSLADVVGGMVLAAERYQAKAVKQEDVALAWSIERDKVKLLKELGLVGDRREHEGVKLTLEVLGQGYERARVALGRASDARLTGQVVDVEAESVAVPQEAKPVLELPRRLPVDQGEPVAVPHDPPQAPAVDQGLEDALEQDLQAALEGPGEPVRALRGDLLRRARRAAGHPQH